MGGIGLRTRCSTQWPSGYLFLAPQDCEPEKAQTLPACLNRREEQEAIDYAVYVASLTFLSQLYALHKFLFNGDCINKLRLYHIIELCIFVFMCNN